MKEAFLNRSSRQARLVMRVAVSRAMKTATILMPTGRKRCSLI